MRKNILCDIDHTVSNAFWRDDMINARVDWDAYHKASIHDEPIHDVVMMLNALSKTFNIIGITMRPDRYRNMTMAWLSKHGVEMHELLMRADDAFRPAPETKMRLAIERFPNIHNEVACIIDDRDDVCTAFRGYGITAMQVHGRKR